MATPTANISSFTPEQKALFQKAASLGSGVQTTDSGTTYIAGGTSSAPTAPAPVAPAPTPTTPAALTTPVAPTTTAQTGTAIPTDANLSTVSTDTTNTKSLQDYLVQKGYLNQTDVSGGEGVYGPKTTAAVAKLQQDLGVNAGTAAGMYGPKTRAALQAKYGAAPQDAGAARSAISDTTTKPQDTSAVDAFMGEDTTIQGLFKQINDLLNPQTATTSLMDDYNALYKSSGLDSINKELIDADTVINGTEDDIRNEIQGAGGTGTESQIQAMALSRNKNLIKRYNQLVQQQTAAQNQLNTMSSLNAQDKQIAQTKVNSQIQAAFQMATFAQQAQNNIREQAQWLTTNLGADGLYNAYKNDPRQMGFLEQALGLPQGGLASVAQQASLKRAQENALAQAQINSANRANQTKLQYISGTANQPGGTFNPDTGVFTATGGAPTTSAQATAVAQGNITTISSLLKNSSLSSAVGPNSLARFSATNWLTGAKSNFVAGVEQVRQQLTLDALQNAKQNGATFGALSDSELNLLSQSSTKLGTWAVKDGNGNVVGYNANEKDFKAELDKINNYAKLDYVLKGGDASSVGVQIMPDGKFLTQNSDGSYTQLN